MIINSLMDWHFSVQQGMYFDKQRQANGYAIYSSDVINDGFWNYAVLAPNVDLSDALPLIEDDFRSLNRTPCIYLLDDVSYESRHEQLGANDYSILSEESVMLLGCTAPKIHVRANLNVRKVIDEKTAVDFLNVFTSAYGGEKTPEQPYGELDKTYFDALSRTFHDTVKYFHCVCYEVQSPVSIATLCFVDGKGGLYNVGTSPHARGKGYGTVATKACIDEWCKLGGTDLFLQTETGSVVEQWYYKLGFELQFVGRIFSKGRENE
jgi:GNAT superfamily N-acetyltransferase